MAGKLILTDRWGNEVRRDTLTREVAAPTVTGVRSPLSGYPGDGLNPLRLAEILRAADYGDPVRYLELAETIEERDPHYLAVLGTRRRSVSQIEVTVDSASEDPRDVAMADMIRDWLDRDELADEVFHILDCLGKGVSFTEILWEVSEGQWRPRELKRRDPRHFRFARHDLETPVRLDDVGREVPLEPFKFIYANIAAKSGLPLRSGLARVGAWGWMFKALTLRDWATIFTQTYGQPLRVGKWHQGASDEDKDTLFRAVANIAGDCGAIIPATMELEFIESKSIGASADLYEARADWFDRQISKALLGQTTTTDAVSGGHAVSQEHRQVQEDIETADAKALSAILNRDLIRPWVDLEFGPQKRYPRLRIARPKQEDIKGMSEALAKLVPLGLRISEREVRDRMGFADPGPKDVLLGAPIPASLPDPAGEVAPEGQTSKIKRVSGVFKRGEGLARPEAALQAEGASAGKNPGGDPTDRLTDQLALEAAPKMAAMVAQIEAMLTAAGSLEEFREMLLAGFPALDSGALAQVMAAGLLTADLAGRAAVADEAADA